MVLPVILLLCSSWWIPVIGALLHSLSASNSWSQNANKSSSVFMLNFCNESFGWRCLTPNSNWIDGAKAWKSPTLLKVHIKETQIIASGWKPMFMTCWNNKIALLLCHLPICCHNFGCFCIQRYTNFKNILIYWFFVCLLVASTKKTCYYNTNSW